VIALRDLTIEITSWLNGVEGVFRAEFASWEAGY